MNGLGSSRNHFQFLISEGSGGAGGAGAADRGDGCGDRWAGV